MGMADGHEVEVAEWQDTESLDNFTAYGTVINEGLLAGMLHEVYRIIDIGLPIGDNNGSESEVVRVVEHQTLGEGTVSIGNNRRRKYTSCLAEFES